MLELRWSDAEERLQGTIHPAFPREGQPLTVSLHVGNFQGAEFDGPLTLTFHQVGAPALVTRTLTRQGVNWHTELTPDASGLWELEVRYRHTHLKVLTAQLSVADQPLPRGLGWGLITVAAGTALVLGMRGVLRRIRAQASESGPAAGTAGSAPPVTSATASSTPEASTATPPPPLASETPPSPGTAPLASAGSPASPLAPETPSEPAAATTPAAPSEAPAATTPAAPSEAPAASGSDAASEPPADPSSTR
ncbi:hypothetical protein [Pyxidicoccus trucidator]|uniref:hypothetical protein n=1 Tax=Pyxidicoccus trucidator TaxID=2709662 RepID=UPI00196706B9|nr:hypothetical protein [Pyxidicoccus trucidator]